MIDEKTNYSFEGKY